MVLEAGYLKEDSKFKYETCANQQIDMQRIV